MMDQAVLDFFQARVWPGFWTSFFAGISFLAHGGWFWIVLTLALMIHPKTRKAAFASGIALILMLVLNNVILKNIIDRPRPYEAFEGILILAHKSPGSSFPSGHTASSFASAAAIFWHHRKWGIPALCGAALIGFSRVYLSVHYLTDVLGGALFGLLYAGIAIVLVNLIWKRWGDKLSPVHINRSKKS